MIVINILLEKDLQKIIGMNNLSEENHNQMHGMSSQLEGKDVKILLMKNKLA